MTGWDYAKMNGLCGDDMADVIEAELNEAREHCAAGDHAFEMVGQPPWKCVFCGLTPELK